MRGEFEEVSERTQKKRVKTLKGDLENNLQEMCERMHVPRAEVQPILQDIVDSQDRTFKHKTFGGTLKLSKKFWKETLLLMDTKNMSVKVFHEVCMLWRTHGASENLTQARIKELRADLKTKVGETFNFHQDKPKDPNIVWCEASSIFNHIFSNFDVKRKDSKLRVVISGDGRRIGGKTTCLFAIKVNNSPEFDFN